MPPSTEALQSVSIHRYESRTSPLPHIVYPVSVIFPVRSWTVWRRYSDFTKLHADLCAEVADNLAPPRTLPPKHAVRRTLSWIPGLGGDDEAEARMLHERREGLEEYLRAIVLDKDGRWRQSRVFRDFLAIPSNMAASPVERPSKTSSLLDTYTPGAWAAKGRRSDRADEVDSAARTALLGHPASALPRSHTPPSRRATDGAGPIERPPSSAASASAGGRSPLSRAPTRYLGARPPPQETEVTRPLDDAGLLQLQRQEMDNQDSQLSDLSAILQRQKMLGIAIGNELQEQNEMLDDFNHDLDRTEKKFTVAQGQMRKLGK